MRAYLLSKSWNIYLIARMRSIAVLQRCMRRTLAFRVHRMLSMQRASEWEQLWDSRRNYLYYYNYVTGKFFFMCVFFEEEEGLTAHFPLQIFLSSILTEYIFYPVDYSSSIHRRQSVQRTRRTFPSPRAPPALCGPHSGLAGPRQPTRRGCLIAHHTRQHQRDGGGAALAHSVWNLQRA